MNESDSMEVVKTGGGVGGALLALAMVLQRAFKKPAPVRDMATAEALKSMAHAIGDLSEKISVLIERLANQAESHDDLKDTVREQAELLREQAERLHQLELKVERLVSR